METCTTGDNKSAAVDTIGGGYLEIMTLEVETADEVPEVLEKGSLIYSSHPFVRSANTNLVILEGPHGGREEMLQRPENMIIYPNSDGGLDFPDSSSELHPFIRLRRSDDINCSRCCRVAGYEVPKDLLANPIGIPKALFSHRNNQNLERPVFQHRTDTLVEIWILRLYGGYNDCGIRSFVSRVSRNRCWFV